MLPVVMNMPSMLIPLSLSLKMSIMISAVMWPFVHRPNTQINAEKKGKTPTTFMSPLCQHREASDRCSCPAASSPHGIGCLLLLSCPESCRSKRQQSWTDSFRPTSLCFERIPSFAGVLCLSWLLCRTGWRCYGNLLEMSGNILSVRWGDWYDDNFAAATKIHIYTGMLCVLLILDNSEF